MQKNSMRASEQLFNYIMVRKNDIRWDDDDVNFVLDQRAELDFYSASSVKQQFAGTHVAPLRHIILILCQHVLTS